MASGTPDGPLEALSRITLGHYEREAAAFRAATWDHDVTQNIVTLLRHLHGTPPYRILDLGCGPGRDLIAFTRLGHIAVGIDGAEAFVTMARELSGCKVWRQDFLHLDLPAAHFDGVFANASLFHVPRREIARVLGELRAALKPGGVLLSSNPRGEDQEGWSGGRYGVWWREDTWRETLCDAGFIELESYYRPPGLPREQQPWFAGAWRKRGDEDGAMG